VFREAVETNTKLSSERWHAANAAEVVIAFLKAERHRSSRYGLHLTREQNRLIDSPNLRDQIGNGERLSLLRTSFRRAPLWDAIPSNTEWYRIEYLRYSHLSELLVISDKSWLNFASRIPKEMTEPERWAPPILWAHSKEGPFTVLEGNNRINWVAAKRYSRLELAVLVGVSPDICSLHWPDLMRW
jgi:hypothetical protein